MKKIIIFTAVLCCLSACRKAAAPEAPVPTEPVAAEAPAANNGICKRTPLAEFAPAPTDTDGSFAHLSAYMDQVQKCIVEQPSCNDAIQCLSQIPNETLLAAAGDIDRDARIVRDMYTTDIMEILQKASAIYSAGACDEALQKYESINETVIRAGYHESSLLTSFYPYLIRAAQKKDCEAIRKEIREMPACIFGNANIDFMTLRDDRGMGMAGLNYQMIHYNYMYKRLTSKCGMAPEFLMAVMGISSDIVEWDKATGVIPDFETPMVKLQAKDSGNDDSDDANAPSLTCKRKPLEMIPGTPGKQGDERTNLSGVHVTALNCMLQSCDEAVACIQNIPESMIAAAIEDMKSDAYAEYDEDAGKGQIDLYVNPLGALYQMSACDKAIEAFEKINLRIIQSYGYANSTYLSVFWGNALETVSAKDCEKAALKMRAEFDICTYGNAKLDRLHISSKKIGIPGFAYQVASYGMMANRIDDQNGCELFQDFMMLSEGMDAVNLKPGQDGVDLMDDSQPNQFRVMLPEKMFAPAEEAQNNAPSAP